MEIAVDLCCTVLLVFAQGASKAGKAPPEEENEELHVHITAANVEDVSAPVL